MSKGSNIQKASVQLSKIHEVANKSQLQSRQKAVELTVIAILLVLAAGIRLYRLDAPGLAIDREYRSAIIARAFYFKNNTSIEEWRRDIAITASQNRPKLEPPITEKLTAILYWANNNEHLSSARILTSTFWLIGGIFLYCLTRYLISPAVAIVALAYYLFVPSGVLISRSFQPDSLMMATFLFGLFAMIRYYDQLTVTWYLSSMIVTAFAILHRPQIAFVLISAFIAMAFFLDGLRTSLSKLFFWLYIAFSLTPAALYYGYIISSSEIMQRQILFLPELFTSRSFWIDWIELGVDTVGLTALIGALLGTVLLRNRLPQALLVGLGVGYLVFGIVFNYYVRSISYYHTQLIPIVAIPLGVLLASIFNQMKERLLMWYAWVPAIAATLLVALFAVNEVRSQLGVKGFENVPTAQVIGNLVNHSNKVVYLAHAYGTPLQYYGEFSGTFFPRAVSDRDQALGTQGESRTVEQRLDALEFTPEYFVITNFTEFDKHHIDLKDYLTSNCSVLESTEQYLIYNRCEGL